MRALSEDSIRAMDIRIEPKNECEATLHAVLSSEEVENARKPILAELMRYASVPGFRPGRVPESIVLHRYADDIANRLHDELVEKVRDETIDRNPDLSIMRFSGMEQEDAEDGHLEFKADLLLCPEFDLPNYLGIEVKSGSDEVTDEEVEDSLKAFAESQTKYEPVDRAATEKDMVDMDFTTTTEGKPIAEFCGRPMGFMEGRQNYRQSLDDKFIPGLTEGLIGCKAGDSRDIVCKLDDNFAASELQGKEVVFSCSINEVLEKRVPALTKELIESIVPGKTEEEVRSMLRDALHKEKALRNDQALRDQITDYLADRLSFPLPESIVEEEVPNTLRRNLYSSIQSGNYDDSKDMDQLRSEAREETLRSLRVFLALQTIAEKENIDVSDYEFIQHINALAQENGEKNVKAYTRKLAKENRLTAIRLNMLTTKVMDLLVKNAKITTSANTSDSGEEHV